MMNNDGSGAGWLIATQCLFGVLLYVAIAIYPRSQSIALSFGFLIVLGMVYCGWRGIKLIWKK